MPAQLAQCVAVSHAEDPAEQGKKYGLAFVEPCTKANETIRKEVGCTSATRIHRNPGWRQNTEGQVVVDLIKNVEAVHFGYCRTVFYRFIPRLARDLASLSK